MQDDAKRSRARKQHFLSDIDPETRTATCATCGPNTPVTPNQRPKGKLGWRCLVAEEKWRTRGRRQAGMQPHAPKRHYLSDIDSATHTATCAACGPNSPIHRDGRYWHCRAAWQEHHPLVPLDGRKRPLPRHILSKIDPETRTATCAACGPNTPLGSTQRTNGQRLWFCLYRPRNGVSSAERRRAIEANDGACEICHRKTEKTLHVDHDHKTRLTRGLLCRACNHGIGNFDDSIPLLESAIAYLRRYENPF